MEDGKFLGLLDMFDGGGAGQSGDQFEGGIFSGLLNGIGIKPYGANSNPTEVMQAVNARAPMRGNERMNLVRQAQQQSNTHTPQARGFGFGLPSANPFGTNGANLSVAPPQQQMPDLNALAQTQRQGRAADGLAFALRNPITVDPNSNQGAGQLSAFFQQAVRPGMGPTQRQGTNRHPLASLGFR